MNTNPKLINTTKYLFECNFNDPSFDDETTEHLDAADSLIEEFGWDDVFDCWFNYLVDFCMTEDDVVNFANLYFYYGGTEKPIRDPYRFVSYFYFKVDPTKYTGDAITIFDSIAITLLSRIGDVSLEKNPNYAPEKDPKIIAAVEKWRQ